MDFYDNRDINNYVIQEDTTFQNCLVRVFAWLFIGLLISAGVAYATANYWVSSITRGAIITSCIAEIVLVVLLTARINKISYTTAKVSFIAYAAINGFSLAGLFFMYDIGSIVTAFLLSSVFFGCMALYGVTTKKDLSRLGTIFFVSLISILIVSILNIFLRSSGMDLLIAYIGVALFAALTAFDIQKIKMMYEMHGSGLSKNIAIYGALSLYLDFINIFLRVLKVIAKKDD